MKWKNKGHEFDGMYEEIKKERQFLLLGAGHEGEAVYRILRDRFNSDIVLSGFIDNDSNKHGSIYCGLPVMSMDEAEKIYPSAGIIISIYRAQPGYEEVEKQLETHGYKKNIDYFHYQEFISINAAYLHNEVYFPSVSFLPSTKCNLRCAACLNFTPYTKKFEERSWDKLKSDIDLFFSCVDYVGIFHVSGGEPLLYPDLPKVMTYISDNYGRKVYSLETVTNGTVLPSKEFLQVYHDYPIFVTIDDYREALPEKSKIFDKVVQAFNDVGGKGKYAIKKFDYWVDLAPMKTNHSSWSECQLEKHFDSCHALFQEFRDGNLYLCNYEAYAYVAGLTGPVSEQGKYDFRQFDRNKVKELMEFRLGYSEQGYADFCKRCAGMYAINPYRIKPGEQVKI